MFIIVLIDWLNIFKCCVVYHEKVLNLKVLGTKKYQWQLRNLNNALKTWHLIIFDDYFYRFGLVSEQKICFVFGVCVGGGGLTNSSLSHPGPQRDIQAKWHSGYKNNNTSIVINGSDLLYMYNIDNLIIILITHLRWIKFHFTQKLH